MTNNNMFELMRLFPNFNLATVDNEGSPAIRTMFLYRADERGIVFHTGAFKDVYKQLKENSQVEVSFFNPGEMCQVRVKGHALEVDDDELREEIVNSPGREFLKPIVAKQGLTAIRVFCVGKCRAKVWNMESNLVYPKPVILFAQG